ncbi:MAG: arsenate reductase (glutaredoxin) [Bacteroidetes bacterium]|nr:arsenate reductase (glutaredoxin) [Bacteroidota bacterium]
MIIYHNTRCSKSREVLDLLNKNKCAVEIREYLKQPPTKKELKELLAKLGCKPFDIIRKKEEIFIKKFANKKFTDSEWIQILTEHPVLIERPIVIDGYKAVIGRPTELVIDLIKRKKA